MDKLNILTAAAKYDVACTSSGVERTGGGSGMGSTISPGVCHSFSGDGRCISLLKVLYTNECIFDCKYCINRRSNDVRRTSFTPEELAELTISFYRRNYIEGLFLSSGITRSPDTTMEQIYRVLLLLRGTYRFHGYIHVKAIPGADQEIITRTGWLADRMSVNMELPTAESLHKLAPHKNRTNILTPMRNIQTLRDSDREFHGELLTDSATREMLSDNLPVKWEKGAATTPSNDLSCKNKFSKPAVMKPGTRRFVPAGQSTQFIIGASDDTDYQIIKVSEALYERFDLKRVFYSAFMNVNLDSELPDTSKGPELLREHRLYQADWLLRYYQFKADEILSPDYPSLNTLVDPKCSYALNHLEIFPVEITTASYHTLLRVPGIGVTSAKRILAVRKHSAGLLTFNDLKKMGIVLKRAQYFITCGGKSLVPIKITQSFILANLLGLKDNLPKGMSKDQTYEQLSLFDVSDIVEKKIEQISC
ncbi:MAG: putative DNA modification/repair radical SAM protein [Lachnospiraceae bacterium]|nr:putative DNA modification/repair radical SAM protein [Lachnospiraceae bacterium]